MDEKEIPVKTYKQPSTALKGSLMVQTLSLFQASSANNLIADEYLKDAKTPEEIRDGFTEIMGDLLMTLPVVKVAGYHAGQEGQVAEYASWQHWE